MLTDAKPAQGSDAFGLAREKIRVGPAPGWVVASRPDLGFVPKESKSPSPTTLLLWSVQANIESNETCVHLAIRLETMQAVQHESQWRLELEPQSQTVLIHWIKIHRLNTEIDHTNLDKVHFLQREAGLEGCVIDGCFTALLLLEDVRPGDVLEWCYTMKTRPTLLPENRHAMYHLPAANFGKLLCIVRFDEDRPLKWKSFSEDFKPEEIRENGQTQWRWSRENFCSPEPEVNVPAWHLASPWIQVSDCPDWGIVARSVTSMWESVSSGESTTIVALIEDICSREQDRLARVERVLRLIQDEFRYLSVNLDHGCQIPSPPDTVARRRFGDCKDLCVLLVKMFQQLGVSAKPVLVNTARRRAVATLLPSPGMFDHVVVEYEVEGQLRWVDATIKGQGGGPLKRVLPNFGYGLVLDMATTALSAPPPASIAPGKYRIRESVLLDTTGANSSVAIVATAEGSEAEMMRHYFSASPLADIARERLQHCADRYRNGKRVGELKFRDDRDANEFHVAEVFEVNGFLNASDQYGFCDMFLPVNLINGSLGLPEGRTRRDPLMLPPPCELVHVFEVQSGGVQNAYSPRSRVESSLLRFNQQVHSMPGSWSVKMNLTILDEVVFPNQFDEHSRRVQDIWRETSWKLTVPVGYSCAGRNRAFGALPSPPRPAFPTTRKATTAPPPTRSESSSDDRDTRLVANAAEDPAKKNNLPSRAQSVATPLPLESNRRHERRSHQRNGKQSWSSRKEQWVIVIGFFILVIIGIALMALIISGDPK